jgi:hypothetical protein
VPSNTRTQLIIRSDEAFAAAHGLAAELGTTITEIVVRALREFKAQRRIPSKLVTPEEAMTNLSTLMESVRRNASKRATRRHSNHNHFYDEFGLPQ